jgi:hypothetical protein
MIKFIEDNGAYKVCVLKKNLTEIQADLGLLIKDIDGYFYFFSNETSGGGSWPEHLLRTIADKLNELNKDWDKEVRIIIYDRTK